MTHGSLFSGIGGFDLAAEWAGWTNVFNCEIDPFCQTILKHHFPNAEQYSDIRATDFTVCRGRIDALSGGFPCQPFSLAGKRKGTEDDRHLWPEMLRAIREIQPRWVVGENVFGIVNWNAGVVFEQVCADLEAAGYEVQPYVLPACGVGAPHRRDRVWFVAHRNDDGWHCTEDGQSMGKGNDCYAPRTNKTGQFEGCSCKDAGITQDTVGVRCDGFEPEKKSDFRGFGQSGTGDHVRVCGKTGTAAYRPDTGIESLRRERKKEVYGFSDASDTDKFNDNLSGFNPSGLSQFEKAGIRPDPDTDSCGLRREIDGFRKSRFVNKACPENYWSNFPTQPPVCGRNDGIPDGLDGITFSKWRQESIKAYGNAIVPQVAYQIFKAINAYEFNQ